MYTIFINDTVIYLTDNHNYKDENSFVNYEDVEMPLILKEIENEALKLVYLYHENIDFLWSDFKKQFKIVEAAGGIVFNEHKEVLWIYRNERWDLPKGKIEKNENREAAAIREVEEECGLINITLNEFIMSTYHIYAYKDMRVLKMSHWYKMFADSNQNLIPQIEEGITKVSWLDRAAIKVVLKDTYDNIKLLFERLSK
jgi:ADP-ribose pyrophosphatase YjhB (NUDIX family)